MLFCCRFFMMFMYVQIEYFHHIVTLIGRTWFFVILKSLNFFYIKDLKTLNIHMNWDENRSFRSKIKRILKSRLLWAIFCNLKTYIEPIICEIAIACNRVTIKNVKHNLDPLLCKYPQCKHGIKEIFSCVWVSQISVVLSNNY